MKVFKSKFGYEIMFFITVIFVPILGLIIYLGEPMSEILFVLAVFLAVYTFFLYLNWTTTYTITDGGVLKVKCGGLFNQLIDIQKIKSVSKTRNLISSPAPSLDRIQLTYSKYDILIISPEDKNDFAKELLKVNPKIENRLNRQ